MKTRLVLWPAVVLAGLWLTQDASAQAKVFWEAFNDYNPGDQTAANASDYKLLTEDDGGVLKDFATGKELKVSVKVTLESETGTATDDFGANSPVNAGSPADKLFGGKVTVGNDGLPGVRDKTDAKVSLVLNFTGLDPARRYNFRGTVSRGGNYNDRWSRFTLRGAESFVAAHVDGSTNKNIITKATFPTSDLGPNEVALNSGDNKAGSLVGWDNIEPGTDGKFEIAATQYVGKAPFGNPSAGPYAYAFNALYLAEVEATGNLRVTENPANISAPAGKTATFKVVASSPAAITYQWQKAASGSNTFADVAGATQASYTTPVLVVGDNGAKYRCNITSGANKTVSGEATLTVDGVIPTVASNRPSVNRNAIYIIFSEPMKLDQMATAANYKIDGGLTVTSATAYDATTARVVTGNQTSGTKYTVTITGIEDLAGNPLAANTKSAFTGYGVAQGTVGIDAWFGVLAGLADFPNDARYPNSPEIDFSAATLDSTLVIPSGPFNTYFGRLRAWVTPEESGSYDFFIQADDVGELRISPDESFDKLGEPIASCTAAVTAFAEPGDALPETTATPIKLEKGKRYAIEGRYREGNGNDFMLVAWRKVGDKTAAADLKPIASKFLSYYGPGGSTPVDPNPTPGKITKLAKEGANVVVEWTGSLQSSDDLKTWKDETGKSPLSGAATGRKFFRVKK